MKKLSIASLTIEALGVFKERTSIDLSTSKDRPVILIEGMNGCGKTTLLQLLQVGIYGSRIFGSKKAPFFCFIRDLIRLDTISRPSVSLKINLTTGNETSEYTITREWTIQEKTVVEDFVAYINNKLWTRNEQDWSDLIDDFLPVGLAELFFFDGEKIEEMANPENLPVILKKATEVLLGVGEIDSIITDLIAHDRRSLTKLKLETKADQDDVELLNSKNKELNTLNEMLASKVQNRASLMNDLDEAQKALERFKLSTNQQGLDAFERASRLRIKDVELDNRLTELYRIRLKVISHPYFPFVQHFNILNSLIDSYNHQELAINGQQASLVLSKFNCAVRNRILNANPIIADVIEKILTEEKDLLLTSIGRGVAYQPMNSSRIINTIDELKSDYLKVSREISEILNEKIKTQSLIDAAPSQETIEVLMKKMSAFETNIANVRSSISTVDIGIESLQKLINRLHGQINNLETNLQKTLRDTERMRYMLNASKRAQGVLSVYKIKLLSHKANWLSKSICEHFQNLLRKQNFIQNIVIDPNNYDLILYASSGKKIPLSRLSAGERQMLATAVLRAIMSAKSSDIPVVVDTPLARLDGTHRINLVRNFYTKVSHQVMVLSTDEEISGRLKDEIEQSVAHSYELVYNEQDQATKVLEN